MLNNFFLNILNLFDKEDLRLRKAFFVELLKLLEDTFLNLRYFMYKTNLYNPHLKLIRLSGDASFRFVLGNLFSIYRFHKIIINKEISRKISSTGYIKNFCINKC